MAKGQALTNSQQKVYDCIVKFLNQGKSPSVREICENTGFTSTSTVALHISTLEKKGYITKEKGFNRTIRLVGDTPAVKVPVLGTIRAGQPLLAVETIEEYIPVSKDIARDENTFALRVIGDSMKNIGMYEGDLIIARKTTEAYNRDIVVAMIPNQMGEMEATVKRYFFEDGKIKLVAENEDYEPMIFDNTEILGKVVSLIRRY